MLEIVKNKLYWVSARNPPVSSRRCRILNIDEELIYKPFAADFGPLNLAMTQKYCRLLNELLNDPAQAESQVIHHTSSRASKRANSAYLMCAFSMLYLNRTAAESWEPFSKLTPFIDFVDAGDRVCAYKCTIPNILKGLEKAVALGWFNCKSFDTEEYEHYEKPENGDWNWVIPGRILAFPCPADSEGLTLLTAGEYASLFRSHGITTVIRLNSQAYNARSFTRVGLRFKDLYFEDGGYPSDDIIREFLGIVDKTRGVAVHCKAGLGRTGTLIAIYLIRYFDFTVPEAIGWLRLCRPGSVIGSQQYLLEEYEGRKTSIEDIMKREQLVEQDEQATKLLSAKRGHYHSDRRVLNTQKFWGFIRNK